MTAGDATVEGHPTGILFDTALTAIVLQRFLGSAHLL